MVYSEEFFILANQLINAGRFIDSKGWVPATSGNFSARLSDGTIAITVSGVHKGHLKPEDIMLIDADANSLDNKKPSAEAVLHTSLYKRFPQIQSILHPHPINATLVSRIFRTEIILENYELLKALNDINSHESRVVIPIFANDQNIPRLAEQVDQYMVNKNMSPAYLIAGHGLYSWGNSVNETLRHLEALDFLFECELRLRGVKNQ
ncbi:Methylthioribulose-1-phosphate dehydratase [Candidatus Methylobacter favarea]|uniref:Methylthioribulose-1-phosphate dehydratase n=1 Tax=Candidatus Methylobacter favarea TaxID=2707345 RepID=A0A8S0X9L7_9GAMM|nr:methylthioribulose 1-phosphate dehydratase [Candidatus Methylobacter favarea]CAA9892426.1 Methylthioribulose-1-phosphate dehydratase [Candidatus Methylobacter favarea]